MQKLTLLGVVVALGTGLIVSVQGTLFTLLGRVLAPFRASLVLGVSGGLIAGVIVAVAVVIQGREAWVIPRTALLPVVIAGGLGLFIVTGVAFAFQRTGIAAGTATVFLGQMVVGIVVDALGWSGGDPIPLEPRRIIGLVVMAVAVYLLVR